MDASTAALSAAIRDTLEDPAPSERARRFATDLAGHPGLDSAIEIVESLLEGEQETTP